MTDRRHSPFEDLEEMMERMSRRFEEHGLAPGEERETPAIDVSETDGEFTVTVDLPGFDEEDIDIRVVDATLHLQAEREEETEREEGEEYLRRERRHETVTRTIRLPAEVDEEGATADYQNGVLTVTLPKAEEEEEAYTIPLS